VLLRLRLALLRWRSRKRPQGPDNRPAERSDDAEGWLMIRRPDGSEFHFAPPSVVTRGMPAELPQQAPRRPLKPSEVLRQAARRRSDDRTWGR
jgi:hypothetical protein